jgi:Flp pilus assembly pilin Flp
MILNSVQWLWIRSTGWRERIGGKDQTGAGLVEYSLLIALIALVVFGAMMYFGESTNSKFSIQAECFESECHGTP